MVASGDFDDGAGEQLSLSGPDDPVWAVTHISQQVGEDAESGADDDSDQELDAGRIDLDESDDRDDVSAALRFAADAGGFSLAT